MKKKLMRDLLLSSMATIATFGFGATVANADTIVVKAGDTLSSIARTNDISLQKLASINNIKNINNLLVGQKLKTTSSNKIKTIKVSSKGSTISTEDIASKAATYATKFIGHRYVWGGSTPAGFDCSGLVAYAYAKYGVSLPHQSGQLAAATTRSATSKAQAGDLLFWTNRTGRVYHVAISLGDGTYVNALDQNHGVVINGMASKANFAGRVEI